MLALSKGDGGQPPRHKPLTGMANSLTAWKDKHLIFNFKDSLTKEEREQSATADALSLPDLKDEVSRAKLMNPNPELIDDDNPEWTEEDFKNTVPFSALPESLQATLRGLKIEKTTKISTTVCFDKDVIDAFRMTGKGWQTRMNEALKE